MASQYAAVDNRVKDSNWTPFLKQLHIGSGVWTLYFMNGLSTGAPTVFIPQIRREWNSTVIIDDDLASWLYSASNFTALPWIFFLPALSQLLGRKIPFLACCFAMTSVFALLYFSTAPYHILIAEAIHGFVNASSATILIHMIPEYCNHRYRNMYLNVQSTSFYWGMWVSNAIGTFFSWKFIPILGLICAFYTFTISFYPESPRWLANKRKFRECEMAHVWLNGSSREAEKELRDLIKSHLDYPGNVSEGSCSRFIKSISSKHFYMPLFLVILAGAQYNLSGKFTCSIYSIELLKKITKNENAAYTGMLLLDGVTVFGMYIGSFLSKIIKLRPLFFTLSIASIMIMLSFSLYLYFTIIGVLTENNVVTIGFLGIYSLTISTGPIILCLSIYSEIVPIRHQSVSYVIASFVFLVSCTSMLKFSPILFSELGVHGSFLFFGIASGVATVLLYAYLPETKNKTLEEIERCFDEIERLPEVEALTKTSKEENSM